MCACAVVGQGGSLFMLQMFIAPELTLGGFANYFRSGQKRARGGVIFNHVCWVFCRGIFQRGTNNNSARAHIKHSLISFQRMDSLFLEYPLRSLLPFLRYSFL